VLANCGGLRGAAQQWHIQQPIEDAPIADAGAFRFAAEVGFVALGEHRQLFGRGQQVVELT
jgi:hypothetical protein